MSEPKRASKDEAPLLSEYRPFTISQRRHLRHRCTKS
jgi:hypothetical protein